MNGKPIITISEEAKALAERRAREEGFNSLDAYVAALIEDDRQTGILRAWMRERLEQGLSSPIAGNLDQSKVQRLVGEGISRVPRGA